MMKQLGLKTTAELIRHATDLAWLAGTQPLLAGLPTLPPVNSDSRAPRLLRAPSAECEIGFPETISTRRRRCHDVAAGFHEICPP